MELSRKIMSVMCIFVANFRSSRTMFTSINDKLASLATNQLNYGISIVDIDHDGKFEMFVAGYSGPNLVLKYNEQTQVFDDISNSTKFAALKDPEGNAIGVCACDIDGDGKEEIYVLNTNQAYAGKAAYGDKIFKWVGNKYVDLFSSEFNKDLDAKSYAGRSVACVDRLGNGKYSFILATYSSNNMGKFALIEMDSSHPKNDVSSGNIVLKNVAGIAGIDKATGGRGITVGPIMNDEGKQDIFFDNEGNSMMANSGNNFLFRNNGDGTFTDIANDALIHDGNENGRGVALADFNNDGLIDIVYGNWVGKHRMFIQSKDDNGKRTFKDKASPEMAVPTPIRTVMAVDFDNDGKNEVFYNNIVYYGPAENKLFRVDKDLTVTKLDIGDALEPNGYGTGGAYHDFDGDGFLEVALAHGESSSQSLTLYKVSESERSGSRNWIRIYPLTQHKAPARGSLVTLTTSAGTNLARVIDAGSGYLCEMEPIAHFGLGGETAAKVKVQWSDGKTYEQELNESHQKTVIRIKYPSSGSGSSVTGSQSAANVSNQRSSEKEEL